VEPWLPIYYTVRTVLVFTFEITFMAAVVGAVIAILWLISAAVAYLLEYLFPWYHSTSAIKVEEDPPGTCPVPSPFEEPAPTCGLSQWEHWSIYSIKLSTNLFVLVTIAVMVVEILKRAKGEENKEEVRHLKLAEMAVNEPLEGLTRRRPV
jgi:hypothetical protein